MTTRQTVTDQLARAAAGDRAALDGALPLVYDELRRLARRQLRGEDPGHTLNTGALVHEAYLRLVDQTRGEWRDRAHFFAVAATAMRRVLVDHARRHHAAKRGAAARPVGLEAVDALGGAGAPDGPAGDAHAELLVDLDAALARLAALDARQARVVECRFFAGLTEEETAAALGIGLRTAKRDWAKARSWLFQALHPERVA